MLGLIQLIIGPGDGGEALQHYLRDKAVNCRLDGRNVGRLPTAVWAKRDLNARNAETTQGTRSLTCRDIRLT